MSKYDKDYIHNKKNGGTIYCYGNIEEDSNFILSVTMNILGSNIMSML